MLLRTCPVCEFSTTMDDWESFSRQHPRCSLCGLLFGEGHLAENTNGLCQFCAEEEIPYEVSLDEEDIELNVEESC